MAKDEGGVIPFNGQKYRALKARYDEAVRKGEEQFEFEGHPLLTSYAKFVVEYLAVLFGDKE